jgi:hypothetical protein
MSIAERYTREIYRGLRYWATWSPGVYLRLGDCGPISHFIFHRERSVHDYGIEFSVLPGAAGEAWVYATDGEISWNVQAAGDAQKIPGIPAGQAAISVDFGRESSIVFVAPGGVQSSVADIAKLKMDVVEKALRHGSPDIYPLDFAVVTDLVTVDGVTVLISEARGGQFVASASADLTAGLVSLGDTNLGITLKSSNSVAAHLVAKANATPLFRGFKLKRSWWGTVTAGGLESASADGGRDPFVDIEPSTLTL